MYWACYGHSILLTTDTMDRTLLWWTVSMFSSIHYSGHEDRRSLHCALFSRQTPSDSTYPESQFFSSGMAGFVQWLSGDFPVTFRCMLARLVSPTDFSSGQSSWNITKPAESPPEITRQQQKVQWNPPDSPTEFTRQSNGIHWTVQRTTSRPAYLLLLLIKNQIWINKANNTLI